MRNIEFKAELRNIDAAREQCRSLAAQFIGIFEQTDTYYRLTDGRLKRRMTNNEPPKWIFYHRPDRIQPRMSSYSILTDEQARRRWGVGQLHEWLTVKKSRELWLLRNVRIHLDQVEQLGTFLELEAIVSDGHSIRDCQDAISGLRDHFGPILGEPVAVSYCDLMEQDATSKR
jgi:adenylate cyclase, class 2